MYKSSPAVTGMLAVIIPPFPPAAVPDQPGQYDAAPIAPVNVIVIVDTPAGTVKEYCPAGEKPVVANNVVSRFDLITFDSFSPREADARDNSASTTKLAILFTIVICICCWISLNCRRWR